MELYSEGTVTHLQGDLTLAGVTLNIIDSLAEALHRTSVANDNKIQIVCDNIRTADVSGLQLLSVWMQCARFRGMEPELVDLPRRIKRDMLKLGMNHCFADTDTKRDIPVGIWWSRKVLTYIQLRVNKYEELFHYSLSLQTRQKAKLREQRRVEPKLLTRHNTPHGKI